MTIKSAMNPWFPFMKPASNACLRLFCFSYAGGSAMIYRSWPDFLSQTIEVCALQIPGRGARLQEKPFTQMQPLVDEVAEELSRWMDKPFVFFGHSMGATLGFEVARKLHADHGVGPEHLFVSGRRAPHRPSPPAIYDLPEQQFIAKLRQLKGTPNAVLEHEEFLQLLIPMLRADFEVIETYQYAPLSLLRCPITAMGGLEDDEVGHDEIQAWREVTSGDFSMNMFPGDHFFLHSAQTQLLQTLSNKLQPLVDCVSSQQQGTG